MGMSCTGFEKRKTAAQSCQGWARGGGQASDWRCQGGENRWTLLGWDENFISPRVSYSQLSEDRKERCGGVLLVSEQQGKLRDVKREPRSVEREEDGGPGVNPGGLQWRWWAVKTASLCRSIQLSLMIRKNRWNRRIKVCKNYFSFTFHSWFMQILYGIYLDMLLIFTKYKIIAYQVMKRLL